MELLDGAVWTLAVCFFFVGDWATTRYGLARQGVIERNPLARRTISRFGVTTSLVLLKTGVLAVTAAGYLYAAGDTSTQSYRLLFPLVVFLVGAVTTVYNLRVLLAASDG